MAQTAKYTNETDQIGCGFMSAFFHPKSFKPKKSVLFQDTPHQKTQLKSSKSANKPTPKQKPITTNNTSQLVRTKRPTKEPTFTSTELISLTLSDQRKSDANRASTGNVMLLAHLGNLKRNTKSAKSDQKDEFKSNVMNKSVHHQLGNILNSPVNKLNADVVKSLGNDKYKQGKYEEALALYDKAISIDPNKACYYSNKSAALIGLGRLVEAVFQCREAVRIDCSYHNAHCRLAKLYLRLGVAEKAVYHYKLSGRKVGPEEIDRAQKLKKCVERCIEAKNNGEWRKVVNESQIGLSLGADSAPQIHAMKAEALMKLHKHQEAYNVIQNSPHFNVEHYAELLGPNATANILKVHSLVYMANGRFEDAVSGVQQALRLDSSDSMKITVERVKCVASTRLNGNRLFKGCRFSEALIAYNKGLEVDSSNSVLLCNRGACRFKLGQYEKAVDDCTAALFVRPSYNKARLRRANCFAQLEKWEAAIEDYNVLMQETPGDEEVSAALLEAKIHLNKLQNGHYIEKDTISNLSSVSSNKDFKYFTTSSGLSVVLFCSKMCTKKMVQLLEQVCLKFPSVNFLKVDFEDNISIAKSEGVSVMPTFRIYQNGSQVKEIGDSFDRLESCINSYCT